MTIKFACPNCNKTLKAPEEKAGAKLTCPACKGALVVPDVDLVLVEVVDEAPPEDPSLREGVVEYDDGVRRDDWVYYSCSCRAKLRSPIQDQGTKGSCPNCGRTFAVPRRIYLAVESGPRRPGMVYNHCSECRTNFQCPVEQLGGVGLCPNCKVDLILPAGGLLERNTGPRRDRNMVYPMHPACKTNLRCRKELAGIYANCPVCAKLSLIPRRAEIKRLGSKTKGCVVWGCAGCGTDVQADLFDEGALGVCPGCDGTLIVPRRYPVDDGKEREGWLIGVCLGCKERFRFLSTETANVAVCPGCLKMLLLPRPAAPSAATLKQPLGANLLSDLREAARQGVERATGGMGFWAYLGKACQEGWQSGSNFWSEVGKGLASPPSPGAFPPPQPQQSSPSPVQPSKPASTQVPSGREVICSPCQGRGWQHIGDPNERRCPGCGGRGVVNVSGSGGKQYRETPCGPCRGKGWQHIGTPTERRCPNCGGQGVVRHYQ